MTSRAVGLALLCLAASGAALAQEVEGLQNGDDASGLLGEAEGRLLHPGQGGYHVPGGRPSGYLVGLDLGAALPLAASGIQSQPSVSLGGRLGYEFANGLEVALRYEDLGLGPTLVDGSQLQVVAFGVRYDFPFLIPSPFIEAAGGLCIASSSAPLASGQGTVAVGPGGSLGLGVSFPITHHFAVDVGGRDWLSSVAGEFFQVISVEAGVRFVFAGH